MQMVDRVHQILSAKSGFNNKRAVGQGWFHGTGRIVLLFSQ